MDENDIDPRLIEEGWLNADGTTGENGLAFLATQDFI
jgi:hypothetical protein